MSINPVNPISKSTANLLVGDAVKTSDSALSGQFSNILSEAIQNAEATDFTDKVSAVELLTGQSDSMSGVLLDAQKAEIALNLTLQIRNKMLEAYDTIMRMQV